MSGPYNIYPAVDAEYNFPPEIRTAFIESTDVQAALDGARDAGATQAGKALTGIVNVYAGSVVPTGWLLCDGSAVDRATYPDLYAAIGTTYGVGDGSSTFNLPNLRGRVVVGVDGTTEFQTLGTASGEKYHQLNTTEMPTHSHGITDPGHNHSQNAHAHDIYDPGHGHGVADPGHGHGIYDPGHGHGVGNGQTGVQTYQEGVAVRRQVQLQSGSTYYAVTSNPDNTGMGFSGIAGSGTGISVNGSGTGIGIYANGTGIGIYGSTPTNNPSGTGVSVQNNGSGGAHNNMQPYMSMNYIIHI